MISMIGSSPRVWGKRLRDNDLYRNGRFIPTGVGKTCVPSVFSRAPSVHPHGCGENIRAAIS